MHVLTREGDDHGVDEPWLTYLVEWFWSAVRAQVFEAAGF
jgi:hypothetical protein